jgi:hypothetical protein
MSRYLIRYISEIHNRLMAQFALVEQLSDKATRALCEQRT